MRNKEIFYNSPECREIDLTSEQPLCTVSTVGSTEQFGGLEDFDWSKEN
jgi:hypothetical protein